MKNFLIVNDAACNHAIMEERNQRTTNAPSRAVEMADQLVALTREAFAEAKWRVTSPTRGGAVQCDFVARKGRTAYGVVLRAAADSRRQLLQSFLADAALRARAWAGAAGLQPLALVGAPRLSDRQAEALHEYGRSFVADTAYGVVDGAGRLELRGKGLDAVVAPPRSAEPQVRAVAQPSVSTPFSDVNQWLLKVLLAPRFPPGMLSAPRGDARNAHRLARLAGVSAASSHRFVRLFERLGFVMKAGGIRVVDEERLFEAWRSAVSATTPSELRLRWALPRSDGEAQLAEAMVHLEGTGATDGRRHSCLALYAAAERLGFPHVLGVSPHVYLRRSTELMPHDIGAVLAGPQESADLHVLRPITPVSVFRGAVEAGGATCADIVQVWLDTSRHSTRGREQADVIWRRVIEPAIVRGGAA